MSTAAVLEWVAEQNRKVFVNIAQSAFSKLKQWDYADGRLQHASGKFFTIDGIRVTTDWGTVPTWEQPIINQPEIGYLGFITRHFEGVLHFLVQAKIEPGNVNSVQLSPTLQATKSNYRQVHKGNAPLYLEYFRSAKPHQILVDQLQSEQGARFLRKRNRNIIIYLEEEVQVHDNFVWLTLGQLKALMLHDNLVNMDARTVISGVSFGVEDDHPGAVLESEALSAGMSGNGMKFLRSAMALNGACNNFDRIVSYLTRFKAGYELSVERRDLKHLAKWVYSDERIAHEDGKYFEIIPVDVQIENREVVAWSQPMVQPKQEGLCAFVCKEINGVMHFAVQAKLECGNHDIIEFAPTVQCLTGNYRSSAKGSLPFLEYVLNAAPEHVLYDALQSEEGGRFYREQNRNRIVLADDSIGVELPEQYIWMTLHQIFTFIKFNNFFNIQARSLIAAIRFV